MALTLRQNFLWTSLGNVVYGGFQWGIIIILCKLGNPEMVGHYALGVSICAPIFMFAGLNLRLVQATDVNHDYTFNHYLGLRLITSSLALAAVFLIVALLGYRFLLGAVILLVGIFKLLEALSETIYGFLQRIEQMDFIGISLTLKSLLSLLAFAAALALTHRLVWAVLGLAAASALTFICYDTHRCRRMMAAAVPAPAGYRVGASWVKTLRPAWEWAVQLQLVKLSLPLGVAGMLIALTFNIPRYFIKYYLGAAELGIYSAMFQLMLAGSILMMAVGQTIQPRLARYYACRDLGAFCRLLFRGATVAALAGLAGWLFSLLWGKPILTIFYHQEYARHTACLQWVMASSIFYYLATILIFGVTAMRSFKNLLLPFAASAAAAGLSSWLLIPAFGLMGAAWALCIINLSNTVFLGLLIVFLFRQAARQT
ncbi:MAG: oligosaccharide flippase family protein [Deltaproteobacteria bacterium]|nr:oligosaccharide flippase family protein [Deltaproteobacteria bacterium]